MIRTGLALLALLFLWAMLVAILINNFLLGFVIAIITGAAIALYICR